MDLYVPVQSRPPGQKKNYDSWNGHGFSIRLYCYGTIGMTQEWLMHDNITPAETIVKMMFNSMPERLKELFFGK